MLHRLLPVLLLPLTVVAQTITFAEGTPADLSIVSVSEGNPNGGDSVVLSQVELLPIEITGRTLAQESDPTRSRLVDRNGLVRVELPGGARLFRYRRAGGQFWGFLRIAANGQAQVVFERPGVGAVLADPFFDRIGVSPDGRHAAIALQSGGLRVARLDGTVFASTGTPVRLAAPSNLELLPLSVTVGNDVVWFQADDADLRCYGCALADGASPVDVSPTLVQGADFKDQMVTTPDGSRVVFLYGPINQQRLYTATLAGGVVQLPPPPGKYEEPGYLPESPGEPAMLLNDAGTRLFFIEGLVRDELKMLDLAGALPQLDITENAIFQPYIGTHILPKFAADKLLIAIGDVAAMDWFRADLAAGGGTVVNLTGTGSVVQPFPSGTLSPVKAAPLLGKLLVSELAPGGLSLREIDPATGATAVVVPSLAGAPAVGDAPNAVADVVVRTSTGDQVWLGTTGQLFAAAPPGVELSPTVHGPVFAATTVSVPGAFAVAVFYLPDGSAVFGPPEVGMQQLVLTPNNGVVVVGSTMRYLAPGVFVVLNRPAATTRVVLSGAGA